ncbi:hypothetical protein Strvi_0043 (plasmid) [Streptomyces violaceusniger Tu 4113]|uniref:Uncharacterized protein n=1 Tax=Streptomyces violaceusniger (strain Tu 4113) TaxID=653045 RepID=G2PHH4_STRV4|nr:hypothetical protein Strvi_0043 [Streptomyces violaceusniger Tu 4113]
MADSPDCQQQSPSTPEAPKEPTRLERLKRLLPWGQRKSKVSPPTQGAQKDAGGETP